MNPGIYVTIGDVIRGARSTCKSILKRFNRTSRIKAIDAFYSYESYKRVTRVLIERVVFTSRLTVCIVCVCVICHDTCVCVSM